MRVLAKVLLPDFFGPLTRYTLFASNEMEDNADSQVGGTMKGCIFLL